METRVALDEEQIQIVDGELTTTMEQLIKAQPKPPDVQHKQESANADGSLVAVQRDWATAAAQGQAEYIAELEERRKLVDHIFQHIPWKCNRAPTNSVLSSSKVQQCLHLHSAYPIREMTRQMIRRATRQQCSRPHPIRVFKNDALKCKETKKRCGKDDTTALEDEDEEAEESDMATALQQELGSSQTKPL